MGRLSSPLVLPKIMCPLHQKGGLDHFTDEITKAGYDYSNQIFRMKWKQEFDYDLIGRIIQFNIDDKDSKTFWRK